MGPIALKLSGPVTGSGPNPTERLLHELRHTDLRRRSAGLGHRSPGGSAVSTGCLRTACACSEALESQALSGQVFARVSCRVR
jgi:hypothetical protein